VTAYILLRSMHKLCSVFPHVVIPKLLDALLSLIGNFESRNLILRNGVAQMTSCLLYIVGQTMADTDKIGRVRN